MKKLNLMEIVKSVHAIDYTAHDRNQMIDQVEFDSRRIDGSALFIPLTSGTTDGHQYVQQAIDNGAVATLWSQSLESAPSDQIAVIYVDDTLQAFQALANYYRHLIDPVVIAITGSNGKTTTKDMTANVLTAKYRTHKTQGNYNNEIGLPYTMLHAPEDSEVWVLEMGMSGFGEIATLSEIAEPNMAAITLIGESHLEFLGSRQGIAQAKLEILTGLQPQGIFVYPGNEPLINPATLNLPQNTTCLSVGLGTAEDVYAYDLVEEASKTFFKTNLDDQVTCMIPVMGAYNVTNALIALTLAHHLEVPIEQAIFQLAQFELTASRLEWMVSESGTHVLNDAYNASPTSMRAVLEAFAKIEVPEHGRRIAILGDIRELGPESATYHASLAKSIDLAYWDIVFLFGQEMEHLYNTLQDQLPVDRLYYESSDHHTLIKKVESVIQPQDYVLVKSSLGVDLLQVVSALTGQATHNFLRKTD